MSHTVVLLGPQRRQRTLGAVLESLGVAGPVATVTAGWQEREADDRELHEHLGARSVNLRLYQRAERVLSEDVELSAAYRQRQDVLREVQNLYRLRLTHAVGAALELMRLPGNSEILDAERIDAIEAIRSLDENHLERMEAVHAEFEATWRPLERDAVARECREIASDLGGVDAVAIAGGHVAVLLNRLRLFRLDSLIRRHTVVAWSAGAMALSERVVLFHDSPPQGPGYPEVLEVGLGLAPGIIALPHASRRLRIDDGARVSLFARRFAPATSVLLDPGARVDRTERGWSAPGGLAMLSHYGDVLRGQAA